MDESQPADTTTRSVAGETYGRKGEGIFVIECDHPDRLELEADEIIRHKSGLVEVRHRNSYVRSGLRNSLLREFTPYVNATAPVVSGSVVGYIGVDSDTSAVTGDTQYLHGTSAGTSTSTTIIKAFSPNASINTDGAGLAQVVTAGATFANADFTNGVFTIAKVGFLLASSDGAGNLVDVIGGTGGTAPYNRSLSIGLANAGTFSIVAQIAVTAIAI